MKSRFVLWIIIILASFSKIHGECFEDGTRYKNTSIWKRDSCTHCECINKVIICHKEKCKDPICDASKGEALIIEPNSCCPTCTSENGRSCRKDGRTIAHNTRWKGNNCTDFECTDGVIVSKPVQCDNKLQCGYGEVAWTRPGECCPKCVSTAASCEYNDKTYRDGDVWTPSKCERAKCSNGEVIFQIAKCEPVVCPPGQEITMLPDRCCPECVGTACTYEGNHYRSGEQFQLSPCKHCSCQNGEVTCRNITCDVINDEFDGEQCSSNETVGTREGECCPECLSTKGQCSYDDVTYYHGDLWNTSDCNVMLCNNGAIKTFPIQCSHIECESHEKLVHNEGSCCPECIPISSQCHYNKLIYRHGDEWQTSPCERCACIHGRTQCFAADCAPCPANTVAVKVQGECCPTCEPVTCHSDCETCNGPKYGQCLTCKNPRNMIQEGKCVRWCLPGYYQVGRECKRCHSSCEKCDLANSPNTCTSCTSPLLLQDGSCVEDCIDGFHDDDGVCRRCAKGCSECLESDDCVECANKTMVIQDGECVAECGEKFFFVNNVCKPCHASCASCSSSTSICDSCPKGKRMQNHLCVTECSTKFYETDRGSCEACHKSCASCSGPSATDCLTCLDGKVLHDGKCISKCPAGHYIAEGVCKECHESCQVCLGPSSQNCTVCAANNRVIQPHSDMFSTGQCAESCDDGFYPENKICRKCHEMCASCDGPTNTNCTACSDNDYLMMTSQMTSLLKRVCLSSEECWALSLNADEASRQCINLEKLEDCNRQELSLVLTLDASDYTEWCVKFCPKGTYKQISTIGSMCVPCTSGCASCDSEDHCIDCYDDKVVSAITRRCVDRCEDGYYNVKGRCQPCPSTCTTCEQMNGDIRPRCTSCRDQSTVLQFGECTPECSQQYYAELSGAIAGTPVCKECDWSCNRCWGPAASHCIDCIPGSKLQNGRCVKICTSGFFEHNSTCTPCRVQHCTLCESGDSCSKCKRPYILHENKCVSSCPRRFIHDSGRNTCVPCPKHCLHCTSRTSCDQCDGNTFMTIRNNTRSRKSNVCVKKCQEGYFGDELTRKCQANHEAPILKVIQSVIVTMGQRSIIDDRIIEISDADSSVDHLRLVVEDEPEIGEIQFDDIRVRVGEEIPVEKVHQGRVWFLHDMHYGRQAGTIRIKVTDGHLMSQSKEITILPVSSHSPVVKRNKKLVVSAGKSIAITNETLEITDKDNPNDVTIRVIASPKFGRITSSLRSGREISDFTLQDLVQNHLMYITNQEGGLEKTLDDVINLQVTDQYYVINVALRIEIIPQNSGETVLVTNKPSRVTKGRLLHITGDMLRTVLGKLGSKSKLVYFLKSSNYTSGEVVKLSPMAADDPIAVSNEWVRMEDSIWKSPPLTKFTQEEIDEEEIWYKHSEGLGDVEAFEFEVYDENYRPTRHVDDGSFMISVVPENNAEPRLARGVASPQQMTASDMDVTVLHSGYIRYTDDDTPDRDLIYNITKSIPPDFGTIEHADNPWVPITVFTQSEIDSNKIIFRPSADMTEMAILNSADVSNELIPEDYNEEIDGEYVYNYNDIRYEALTASIRTLPDSASFEYTVSDGVHTLPPATFTIKLLNELETTGPTFTNLHPTIEVTQGGSAPIGEQQLAVSDPDTSQNDLIFALVKKPKHGNVFISDRGVRVIMSEGDSFTHDEIERNALHYVHNGLPGSSNDQIQVSVTDITNTATKVIQISIIETDGAGPSPDPDAELTLDLTEGTTKVLTRENLAYVDSDSTDAQITYHVESELIQGILVNDLQMDVLFGDTFTQQDINNGIISYQSAENIGTKPVTDELHFSVSDRAGNKLSNQKMTITVTPADSQPPTAIVGSAIEVEEGGTKLVTPRNIMTRDADTPKKDLTITITTRPLVGYFLNTQGTESEDEEEKVSFTMQDILDGSIYYVQSLHRYSEPREDFFRFRVSDGHKVSPVYRLNVTIIPSNDEEPNVRTNTLLCKTGHATMILNASLTVADRDTSSDQLVFTVTSVPEAGSLVKFSHSVGQDVMRQLKETGNGSLQLDMMHKKDMTKLRVGSTFTYQDVLDELICYESEGFISHPAALHRHRRNALGFILSDGSYSTPGSINIDVEPELSPDGSDSTSREDEPEEVMPQKTLVVPEMRVNTGITVEKGTTTAITRSHLLAVEPEDVDIGRSPSYVIVRDPSIGYLQLRNNRSTRNLTIRGDGEFYQRDIDDGWIYYVHPDGEPGGHYSFTFNIVGNSGSALPEQRFLINVKEDRNPPVIRVNEGIVVQESSSQKITSEKLSVSDDVEPEQLIFTILKEPAYGRVEFVKKSGHRIRSFTQLDINAGKVQFVPTCNEKETIIDGFTFSVSDGTNTVFQEFVITVLPVDNSLPVLENKGIRVQEGVRKTITEFELKATDLDTNDALVTFTIIQSPLHGNIERTNHRDRYIPVTGFSMEDIYASRISYNHDGSNSLEDRFVFIVEDGTNEEFVITEEGEQVTTSSNQIFHIEILPVDDGTPRLVTNLGLHHLEYMDTKPMGMISKRSLLTEDPDTEPDRITYTITSDPRHGHIESNAEPGVPLKSFTQKDINSNIIRYVLNDASIEETMDSFMFNVRDSMPNVVTGNIFHIRWSVFTLDKSNYTVKESDRKIDITVRRHGNMDYAIVMCRTKAGTATDITSEEPGLTDYVKHAGQVQFDEHEDEKVCTIVIEDDKVYEGEEQFTVELALPNYALLGAITKTTVTIDDSEDKPTVQFDESEKEVQENDDTFFLTVRRTGDINKKVTVICHTVSDTATGSSESGQVRSGSDFKSRDRNSEQSIVVFEPGISTASCDIKLIDDSRYEEDESFFVRLTDPSQGSEVGEEAEVKVTIAGPNDAPTVFFSDNHYEFSENQETVDVTVVRAGSDLSQSTDVWCATRAMDPISAVPGEDFVQSSNKVTFRSGETTKICTMTILDDSQAPTVEGNETFEVYLSSVLRARLVTPHEAVVTINDTLDDVPTMQFLETSAEVKEEDRYIKLAIHREGDISSSSSVICYTRRGTAEVEDDFVERARTEMSRVVFNPQQKIAYCNVSIIDDDLFEAEERFSVRLAEAIGSKWYGATVGLNKVVDVTITNNEDAPTIQFERAEFSIREPDTGEQSRELVVKVIRSGDVSEVSKVRCSTRDGSATSGKDYEPKSSLLRFRPGDTEVTFTVNILPNDDTEWHETFLLVLGPDDPVNAELGPISQATVTVLDKDAAGSMVLPTTPVVVSLLHYDEVGVGLKTDPPPGYPLVCVTPCDPRYPEYADTRNLCEEAGINASAIRFSWEVAMPSNYNGGGNQPFVKVLDPTPFTSVNTKVLDSIYFSRRFHVRCVAQAVDSATGTGGTPLRSNVATISAESGLCHNPIMSGSDRGFQAQSFIAKLEYIQPTAEEHPDSLKISVEIPHQDGRLPLISTMPFNNLRLLLSRSIDRQQHLCSNMMYSSRTIHINPSDLELSPDDHKLGKYLGFIEPTDYSKLSLGPGFDKPFQLDPTVRESKSIDLYKYLNLKSCVWKFHAYYKMSQLTDFCNGMVVQDYQVKDSSNSLVTVKVPLHVSYVYVTAPTGWGALEHRTEMEFSFLYNGILWADRIQAVGPDAGAGRLTVKKMKIREDGRLEIDFETKVQFRGLFVMEHHTLPGRQSVILPPEGLNIKFDLENVWSENRYDGPRQQWRAISKYSKKDYSGEYEIQLLPCIVSSTTKWTAPEEGEQPSCTASAPINFKIPITFQQTNRPVSVVFTLNTKFQLSNNEKLFLMDPKEGDFDYKGSFSKGQTLFGRVLWNPDQDLQSAYKLQLEKVYLCTGRDGYIPTYDPDGSVYNQGAQYGCIQASKDLQHRFVLLDRSNRGAEEKFFHDVPFHANFASDIPEYARLADLPGVDGFLVKVDALYKVEAGHQWYLQVMYVIGPEDQIPSRSRRSVSMIALPRHKRAIGDKISSYKNGTNMRGIEVDPEEGVPASAIAIGVVGTLLPLMLCILFATCLVRRRRRKKKAGSKEVSHIVVGDKREELIKKVSVDEGDDEFSESWPLSGEKEHKRSSSSGLVTVVTVKSSKVEKNYKRDMNINDVELQPLNGSRNSNNAKQRYSSGKASRKKKNIPIVDNLRMNNEDDGTEV